MSEPSPLEIRRVPLASLHLDPANVRAHDERNLAAITASLMRFGQAEPLVIHAGTDRVIGGNGRLVAMQKLGWTDCDVVEVELESIEATALGIALNRTAELATWDEPALAQLLSSLQEEDALTGVGFDDSELRDLLVSLEGIVEVGEDGAPEAPDEPTTRTGDLWVLGRHRLLCGDSASPDDLDRLLAGEPIHLVNTDPPYNVKVEPRSNNAIAAGLSSFSPTHHQGLDLARHPGKAKPTGKMRPKDRPLQNDFVSDEDFDAMLRAWFGNIARGHLRLMIDKEGQE